MSIQFPRLCCLKTIFAIINIFAPQDIKNKRYTDFQLVDVELEKICFYVSLAFVLYFGAGIAHCFYEKHLQKKNLKKVESVPAESNEPIDSTASVVFDLTDRTQSAVSSEHIEPTETTDTSVAPTIKFIGSTEPADPTDASEAATIKFIGATEPTETTDHTRPTKSTVTIVPTDPTMVTVGTQTCDPANDKEAIKRRQELYKRMRNRTPTEPIFWIKPQGIIDIRSFNDAIAQNKIPSPRAYEVLIKANGDGDNGNQFIKGYYARVDEP